MYENMMIDKNKIILTFDHADGLVATGDQLVGFEIAGLDKKFIPVKARIKKNTVIVFSSDVPNPVAVRYAWEDNPDSANLYNTAGLPASPFETEKTSEK